MTEAASLRLPQPNGPSARARLLLIGLVCGGIVFNNLVRWYPFPPGRSANDLTSLDSNLLGIVANIAIYAALLVAIVFAHASRLLQRRSRLLLAYCLYLLLQSPFRASPLSEGFRSFAMAAMLLSADWLAALVMGAPQFASRFLRSLWWSTTVTVFIGLAIGLLMRDAVNWGSGLSPSFENQNRAEFFFFYVLPHYGFALSLAILAFTFRRPGFQFFLALVAVVLIGALAELTMTRTITFSILLVTLVFLFRFARRTLLVLGTVAVIGAAMSPGTVANVADRLRVAAFFDPSVDATTGRLFLILTNLQSFRDAPVFGQGAVEARARVEASGSMARTEHGYSIHLATAGLFAGLLFAYVLQGLWAGIRIVLRRRTPAQRTDVRAYGVAVAALAMASFVTGFFWTFSSATNYYDWLALFFVSAARVHWQMIREAPAPATTPALTPALSPSGPHPAIAPQA